MGLSGRFSRAVKTVLDVIYWPGLLRQRDALDRIDDWSQLVAAVCRHQGRRAIFANQIPSEIGQLCQHLRQQQPRTIVEIGTSQGGTLYLFSRLIAEHGTLISIDLPGGPGSVRYVMRRVYRTFGQQREVNVVTLDRDSHDPRTVQEVAGILAGQPIDFLFIDGDHSYRGVKADLEGYRALVAPTGTIAFHDIQVPDTDDTIQVGRYWREIQEAERETAAFIDTPLSTPGIGVIFNAGLQASKSRSRRAA